MTDPARTILETDIESDQFIIAVEEGIADADAGRTIPYDQIRRWLLSWGTETESPPPLCR